MAWTKEQEDAINKTNTNIIVSAGAGSGKTAVLTARTMRILNSGTHINELLILTFTKAAASEMKQRIRKSLKKSLPDSPSLAKELELIDQAYITTFDSFALSVVKKYHYLLNISNNIGISDSSIIKMQQIKIMDEVFEEFYTQNNPSFNKLISNFCLKDDKELKNSILNIASKIDSFPNREEYLQNYLEEYFSSSHLTDCFNEYNTILKEKLREIEESYTNLSYLVDGEYQEKLSTSLFPLLQCQTVNDFGKIINSIKLPQLPRGSEEEVKKSKENLKSSLDELKNTINSYGKEEDLKESLEEIKEYNSIIISLIKTYLDKLHTYKEENEIYDFQDIALLSIKVLKENEIAREELKSSFKEIMIDEYQDTNDIQETFISMIANNNVYMVGDIKQSIYRFRNANPYIFKNKYDTYKEGHNGLKIDLVKNFRSRKEVLSNINEIFNLIMDNKIGGAEYHESHQMVYGNTSYVEEGLTTYDYNCEILEYEESKDSPYTPEEIEIFTIAQDIKNKVKNKYQIFDKDTKELKNVSYKDFVILMDRSNDFDLYKKIFEYSGIPLTLYRDDKLNNSEDIYILKNIIDYIVKINLHEYDNTFKYDYVSIARSYLYNLSDQEIFNSFKNNNFTDNIVYNTFKDLSEEITETSITSLLQSIIEKTNMYEKMIEVGNIENSTIRISKLFDIASNLSKLGYDIYAFHNYLNEILESDFDMKYSSLSSNTDSVKIMTIHKSKGLEYHICYYSGLYRKFNISDLKERFLFDNKYGIITPYFKEGINESFLKYLVKYHYIEEEISERIRLFYVALTRAKEKMIFLVPETEELSNYLKENSVINSSIRRKYRSFSQILTSIKPAIQKYYHKIDLDSLNLTKEYLYTNKKLSKIANEDYISFTTTEVKPPEIQEVTKEKFSKNLHELINKETKKNIELGLKIHEALELIDFHNPSLDLIEDKFIRNKITKFLKNEIVQDLENTKIYKEHEFIYTEDLVEYHGIIDLMIERENSIDIVDYKLNNLKDENYLKQLNGYKKYISSLTSKKVNIYLYSLISETLEKL